MSRAAWVDGAVTGDAAVSPYDEGWLLGLGVFETVGEFGGRLPLWDRHLARLARGAAQLAIDCAPPAGLRDAALDLLARNRGDDVVRVTLTAGVEGRPTWCMTTRARTREGTAIVLLPTPTDRGAAGIDPLAAIKCTSYAFHALHRRAARAAGAGDALLLAADGRVLETTTGNVFCRRGTTICTPPADGLLLPGVARAALLEALRGAGVDVAEADMSVDDLRQGEGIFVTNAVLGPHQAQLPDAAAQAAGVGDEITAAWRCVVG